MECECGCEQQVSKSGNRFINGHNSRIRIGHPFLGKHHTQESRQQIGETLKRRWSNPETRKRRTAIIRPRNLCECGCGQLANPGRRFIYTHHMWTPENRRGMSRMKKQRWENLSPEQRQAQIQPLIDYHKGRPRSVECRLKSSETHKLLWHDSEYRERMEPISLKNLSKSWPILESLWRTDEYRQRIIPNILRASHVRPTGPEVRLMGILGAMGYPYQYTGNGIKVISGVCPDFWWAEENRVIEMFGGHWHNKEDEPKRIATFDKCNIKCLIIWENELGNEDELIKKIHNWHRSDSKEENDDKQWT